MSLRHISGFITERTVTEIVTMAEPRPTIVRPAPIHFRPKSRDYIARHSGALATSLSKTNLRSWHHTLASTFAATHTPLRVAPIYMLDSLEHVKKDTFRQYASRTTQPRTHHVTFARMSSAKPSQILAASSSAKFRASTRCFTSASCR